MKARALLGVLLLAGCGDEAAPGLASIQLDSHTIHFAAIGDSITLAVMATDADGAPAAPGTLSFSSRDPHVVRVSSLGVVESTGDGATYVVAADGDIRDSVAVTVAQAKDSLVLALATRDPIVSIDGDALVALSCRVFDASGTPVSLPATVISRTGAVEGTSCTSLVARHSGHDTLLVQAGSYQAALPVVIAIRPVVLTDPARALAVDSLPRGIEPWAPTLIRNPQGVLDLYFAAYRERPYPFQGKEGDLHRLVSADGDVFRYDGVALHRDPADCSLQGTGIENIAIVRRADAAGWRMYFSSGSECYGWQVFSAISTDQVSWVKERDIRIPNGGVVPPEAPALPPWPSGEGMVVESLPAGGWRMLVGAYEQVTPRENRFQITAWTSSDQLAWQYQEAVLTTRQVGPEARRSVYSPSVQQLAPGLRRMYFAGDNLDAAQGASRIYSAVSVDGSAWQVEGVVLGGRAADYFYSTVQDNLLVFIRKVSGTLTLGSVRLLIR